MQSISIYRITFFAVISSLLCLVSCGESNPMRDRIVGVYELEENQLINDGMVCDVNIRLRQGFSRSKINTESDVTLRFCFDENFQFNDMELRYRLSANGRWSCADSLLFVDVDTTSVECEFIGSNAQTYTEQTMVRYLRKYVSENFLRDVEQRLLYVGADEMYLDEVDESSLVLSHAGDGRAVMLNRKE